jgi:hypothetical protein
LRRDFLIDQLHNRVQQAKNARDSELQRLHGQDQLILESDLGIEEDCLTWGLCLWMEKLTDHIPARCA